MSSAPVRLGRWAATVVAATVTVLVSVACSGGSSESADDLAPDATSPADTTPEITADATPETVADATVATTERVTTDGCPDRPPGSSSAAFADDGTFAVAIERFDLAALEVTVDVVQWLVGQEADDAYAAETGDSSGVPNDYWVINESPTVRTLPVAGDATVRLVRLGEDRSADVSTAALDELPDYLEGTFEGTTWWATLEAGTVTELCEQYVP